MYDVLYVDLALAYANTWFVVKFSTHSGFVTELGEVLNLFDVMLLQLCSVSVGLYELRN